MVSWVGRAYLPDIFLNVRLYLSGKYARPTDLHPDHSIAGYHALTRFVRKGMSGHSTELPVPAGYWLGLSGDGPGPKGRKILAGGIADQFIVHDWPRPEGPQDGSRGRSGRSASAGRATPGDGLASEPEAVP